MREETPSHHFRLDESLWNGSLTGCRSPIISPLYLIRNRGVQQSDIYTYHSFWEMIVFVSGRASFLCGRKIPVEDAYTVLVPPGFAHKEISSTSVDAIWIGLKGTALESPELSKLTWVSSGGLVEAAKSLWLFSEKGGSRIGTELDGMALALVNLYYRRLLASSPSDAGGCVERAITYFTERFAENLTVADIASSCGLSHSHFSKVFRESTGKTPIEYLESVRMRNALRLLESSSLTVRQISELSGYRNEFYFSKAFRRFFGHPPSACRRAERTVQATRKPIPDSHSSHHRFRR